MSESPVVSALLSAANTILLVLNEQRRILAYNSRVATLRDPAGVLGFGPGDVFGCANVALGFDCGASPGCRSCGALTAVLGSAGGQPAEAECLLRGRGGAAFEFEVRATPVVVAGSRCTVVSLRDVSGEKRREALEQIFLHDVLNTVMGLRGWVELLRLSKGAHPAAPQRIDRLSRLLEREIRDYRSLAEAERGTLVVSPERLRARGLLDELAVVFGSHPAAADRRLEQDVPEDFELESDPSLLLRVLSNMVRNALEATEPGGAVRVACERVRAPSSAAAGPSDRARFSVWNGGAMAPEVQARVFQRSFSTKARHGRGLGTYSMKLLGERYLAGQVSFVSGPEHGTVFRLELPLRLEPGR